jgi:hypothetical protein
VLSRWLGGWDDLRVDRGGGGSLVSSASLSYKGHRYPVEIIAHGVWLYFRFPLSFREVEELTSIRLRADRFRRSGVLP